MGRIGAGILALSVLMLLFQNCGKAGFENQELLEEPSTALSLDPELAKLSFPYEVSINQLAYMSCPVDGASEQETGGIFSWKIGAFDNTTDMPTNRLNIKPAGLQLSQKFQEEWAQVANRYSPRIQKEKLKEVLKNHSSVADTQLQISFRKTNLTRTEFMRMTNGSPAPYGNFLPSLSSTPILNIFGEFPLQAYNHFPEAQEFDSRSLEASLVIPPGDDFEAQALRANYDASFLTIGFQGPSAEDFEGEPGSELIGPSVDKKYAYGKGFRVRFGVTNPHSGTTAYPSSDSLSFVEEFDLTTGTRVQGATWDCSYKFKIVKPQDRYLPSYRANHFQLYSGGECPTTRLAGTYCPSIINGQRNPAFGIAIEDFGGTCPANRAPAVSGTSYCPERYNETCPSEPYSANTAHANAINREDGVFHPNYPERPAILHALRRFLPADQFDINVSRKCIVPKMGACYGKSNNRVIYDEVFFTGIHANPSQGFNPGCGVDGQLPCASYLTLCVRR